MRQDSSKYSQVSIEITSIPIAVRNQDTAEVTVDFSEELATS